MAFAHTNSKGKTYFLHARKTVLKNGHERSIYFFAKDVRDDALDSVPEGYTVSESKNGLPVLKRS